MGWRVASEGRLCGWSSEERDGRAEAMGGVGGLIGRHGPECVEGFGPAGVDSEELAGEPFGGVEVAAERILPDEVEELALREVQFTGAISDRRVTEEEVEGFGFGWCQAHVTIVVRDRRCSN